MALSDLPNEIILTIADHLDAFEINALARTHSQMYKLLNIRHLYLRDVTNRFSTSSSRSLLWAIERCQEATARENIVRLAVEAGRYFKPIPENIRAVHENYQLALGRAVVRGDAHVVVRLLEANGINPNIMYWQTYPLVIAAKQGHNTIVELLLAVVNIDPNVTDQYNFTPLHYACSIEHVSIVKQLLARDDVDPNVRDIYHFTPLYSACQKGKESIVEQLLSRGDIDPNLTDSYHTTPLCAACNNGNVSIVKQLLARGDVDINTGSVGWQTPLIAACRNRNTEIINLLLSKDGIDVNIRCSAEYGCRNTPLMIAVKGGTDMEGVVKSLLARDDLDPNILASNGDHVLLRSVECQRRDIVKLLLDRRDIDPNVQSESGSTALMWALDRCPMDPDIIKLLLDQEGIDVNKQSNKGKTALYLATSRNRLEAVKLLLEREDIDINIPDNKGRTPLSEASAQKNVSMVNLLLAKKGVDPNVRNNEGCTPLASVCAGHLSKGATSIVCLLLSHCDTDPNTTDNNGVSALTKLIDNKGPDGNVAYLNKHEKIKSLMLQALCKERKVVNTSI
jgi:ankyrin repeat protein